MYCLEAFQQQHASLVVGQRIDRGQDSQQFRRISEHGNRFTDPGHVLQSMQRFGQFFSEGSDRRDRIGAIGKHLAELKQCLVRLLVAPGSHIRDGAVNKTAHRVKQLGPVRLQHFGRTAAPLVASLGFVVGPC